MKKSQAFITAALSALGMVAGAGVAHADPTTVWNGATETREEDRRFHVNGRLQYDVAYTDADCSSAACNTANESGVRSYARRAFLGVDGRLTSHWRYNIKFDFNLASVSATGTASPSVRFDDAYLEYAGDDFSFIVGNNNAVSPMEDRDSSLNIPFNERSFLISSSGVGKRPGAAFITNGGNWSWGANVASNDTLDTSDTAANGTESWFVGTRATWAPIFEQTPDGTTVLHLGAYLRYRDNGDGNGNVLNGLLSYSPNPLSAKSNNNAGVGAADSDVFWDLEAAFQWNTFGVDGEYGQIQAHDSNLNTTQVGDGTITGYYVDAFWSLTGESRRYSASDGSFGAITPRRTLGSDGGIGHVMLSARYEDWDATDTAFGANRNDTNAWTLGLTWVPIAHVKFQANYSDTSVNYSANNATHVDNDIRAFTLRTQLDW